jgi:hypothetical protein
VVIELWAVEAFCLTPVIACLFLVAGVVYVGDASVLLRLQKSTRMKLEGHVACTGVIIWLGNLKESEHLEDSDIDAGIILKWKLMRLLRDCVPCSVFGPE